MKKYSKKQIVEAIKHWENKLRKMNESLTQISLQKIKDVSHKIGNCIASYAFFNDGVMDSRKNFIDKCYTYRGNMVESYIRKIISEDEFDEYYQIIIDTMYDFTHIYDDDIKKKGN